MRYFNSLLSFLGLLIGTGAVHAAHLQPHLQFSARLNGAQEVPAVMTDAIGVASFTLNATRDTLCIRGNFTGLSGPITGAHIHDGMPGVNGPVLIPLTDWIMGNQLEGQLIGSDITPELLAAHVRGELYLNIHTDMNPDGEIRGQIVPETDWAFHADINGMQEVPMVNTDATGLATFMLAKHSGKLTYRVVVNGLSGPITGAHLHMAAMGENGDVVLDLGDGIMGNTIMGETDPEDILEALMDGELYINIHTAMHPNGEIRGQVMMVHGVPFDSWLDGMQEVPMVTTMGKGVASVMLTADLDSLWYDIQLVDLSGPAQGAHFHMADPGMNGGVVIDLTNDIMGDRIQGWFTGLDLTDMLINDMLKGGLYLNVHTGMHPNGEIRGQVYRYMREGYTVWMNGMQEVPGNMSMATGGGIVTVDRDQTNAHIMVVMDDLNVDAAHLHQGMMGENGPVVFDLGPFLMDNGVFTYWTEENSTPFMTANSVDLRNNNIYVNAHNMEFPDGEIRGQVLRGSPCSDFSTGIFSANAVNESFTIYPIPSNDWITIELDGMRVDAISVFDAQGRLIQPALQGNAADRMIMDVSNMPSGLYVIRLTTGDAVRTARFIRE